MSQPSLGDVTLRTLLDTSPAPLVVVCKNGIHTDCSHSFARLLGYSREEIVGTHMSFIVHPEDVEYGFRAIKSSLKQPLEVSLTSRCRTKDGNILYMTVQHLLSVGDDALGVAVIVDSRVQVPVEHSVELAQLAIDTCSDGLFSYLSTNDVFYCNSNLRELVNRCPLDTFDQFASCLSLPKAQEFKQIVQDLDPTEGVKTLRAVVQQSPEEQRVFELSLFPKGHHKVLGSLREITESELQKNSIQRQLDEKNQLLNELSNKETSLRSLTLELEQTQRLAKLGYYRFDCATNLFYVSPALQEQIHFITDSYNLTSLDTVLDLVPVNMRSNVLKTIKDCATYKQSFSIDFPVTIGPEDKYLVMRGHPSSFDEDGTVKTILGSIQNITDIRRIEMALENIHKRSETVVNTILDGVIVLEDGKLVMFNESMKHLSITHSASLKIDTTKEQLFADIADNTLEGIEDFKKGMAQSVYRGELKSKDMRYYEVYLAKVESPVCVRCVATFRDISHLKQVQVELEKASEAAKSADRAKSNFLAITSHELRSPLSGILGMISVLKETTLSTEQNEMINIVENSGTLLLSLINDILDFSKIEAGSMILNPEKFRLVDVLVDEPVLMMRCSPSHKKTYANVTFVTFVDPNVDIEVFSDGFRLRQIVLNLLSNAHKFTQQGYVAIEISMLSRQENTITVRILVKDTGCGISTDRVSRLFDPFVQSRSTLASAQGTGLGLPISQRLASLFHSNIKIKSELSVGSEFSLDVELGVVQNSSHTFSTPSRPVLLCIKNSVRRHFLTKQISAFGAKVSNFSTSLQLPAIKYSIILVEFCFHEAVEWMNGVLSSQEGKSIVSVLLCEFNSEKQPSAELKARYTKFFALPATFSELRSVFTHETTVVTETVIAPLEKIFAPDGSHYSVLVCDDNALNLRTSQLILTSLGLDVTIANDGAEAVSLYSNNPLAFDVVLLDYHMPTPGPTASKRIRHFEELLDMPRVVVMGLTADVLPETRDDCLHSGMDEVIQKPFTRAVMYRILNEKLSHLPRRGSRSS
ncbi:hypothetical protein RCL1_005915 [Eukaryota sp. TZLM3-RCL]